MNVMVTLARQSLVLLVLSVSLPAAVAPGAPPAESPEIPGSFEGDEVPTFFLRDRSRISGWPIVDALEVKTQYGTLSVPRDELIRIRFARRIPEELAEKLDRLISELGDEDFDVRERATQELAAIGSPALWHLRRACRSEIDEIKSRASAVVAKIGEEAAAEADDEAGVPGARGTEDEVVTARMTIRGNVSRDEYSIRTRYGVLRVSTSDLTAIAFRTAGPSSGTFQVGPDDQPPEKWFDTKIDLDAGQRIKISAGGQIIVSNYGIASGPSGNTQWSGHATFGGFPMLSLVAKVGKRGTPFLVANEYSGKTSGAGRLYLGVVPFSPNPHGNTGVYTAKIRTFD